MPRYTLKYQNVELLLLKDCNAVTIWWEGMEGWENGERARGGEEELSVPKTAHGK